MGLDAALSISSSGLAAINAAIAVVSQNVSNVSTPGYTREVAVQTAATAQGMGLGVYTQPTTLDVNAQLQSENFQQNASVSFLQVQQQALQQVDAVQGTPGGGTDLASLLGAVQNAFSTLQNDPSNPTQQTAVVTAAQTLTRQINALSASYQSGQQTAQNAIVAGVDQLNTSLATIGSLNSQIIQMQANGQSTADLQNQRIAAETTLSQLVSVTFVNQPNGGLQIYTGSGMTLPTQFDTPPFATQAATTGAGAYHPGGGIPGITLHGVDVTSQLTGGSLGANIALRDTILPTSQAELDEFSQTLSTRFAAQGLSLFTDPSGNVPTQTGPQNQTGYVGYAGIITVNPTVAQTPAMVRDGTQNVTGSAGGASDFTMNPANGPAGFTTLISRVLTYALGTQVQTGVAQPAPNVTGLGAAGTLAAPFAAPADLASFATDLVSAQSAVSAAATSQLTNAQAMQTTVQSALSNASGVSIDTEMGNMVALQNAYGANAKMISTMQSLFSATLSMVAA
jgi:flagellar hook-associated protein 1 FlgK